MTLTIGFAQGIFDRLHQQIRDAALAVGDTNIQRHRRDPVGGKNLAHEYLAHHGAVAVADDQFLVGNSQRQQRLRGLHRDRLLLLRRTLDVLGMSSIATDGYEKTLRVGHSLRHGVSPSVGVS